MNHSEGQRYTAKEAASHLAAVADHLKDYSEGGSTVGFCLECLGKHFSSLRVLASEGQDFFPADRDLWFRLRSWCDETMDRLMDTPAGVDEIMEIMRDARAFRKTIQSKYFGRLGTCGASKTGSCSFRPGGDGPCKCLTGLEPCCRRES